VPEVRTGPLTPGTYEYLHVDEQGFNVGFTAPAGWTWNGRYLSKGGTGPPNGAAIYFFGGPVQVYADPCQWAGTSDPLTAAGDLRDVMAALASQPLPERDDTDRPQNERARAARRLASHVGRADRP
jgi:hypothetical protein